MPQVLYGKLGVSQTCDRMQGWLASLESMPNQWLDIMQSGKIKLLKQGGSSLPGLGGSLGDLAMEKAFYGKSAGALLQQVAPDAWYQGGPDRRDPRSPTVFTDLCIYPFMLFFASTYKAE